MTDEQACMETGGMTTVLGNLSHVPSDLFGTMQRLKPALAAGLEGIGGGNDQLGAAFAAGYVPALTRLQPDAEALAGKVAEQTAAGVQSVTDYLDHDRAAAQCFRK
ncbi:hypothetical protein [Amycolatopsis sp. WGS_07]|uniref:hypothetical protein n=1 Tax=Amycolatopsis sp. WGS_07 TaxID=3076764 RepID=UPI00387347BD